MEECLKLLEYLNNESNFTVEENGEELFDYHQYFNGCRKFVEAVILTNFRSPTDKYFHDIYQTMNSANSCIIYSNMPDTSEAMKAMYIFEFWEKVEKVEGAIKEIEKSLKLI